jgi:hypothetical protein
MPHYELARWRRRRWETDRRYYVAEVRQDLWGRWLLYRRWGSRTTARGNHQTLPADSYEEALALLAAPLGRGRQRGYREVGG